MLLMQSHGAQVIAGRHPENGPYRSVRTACGFAGTEACPDWPEAGYGAFGYFFDQAPPIPAEPATVAALSDLADAMISQDPGATDHSGIPAIFTYIGQFIDHDITANTDRDDGVSVIDTDRLEPIAREEAAGKIANLRTGRLDLDSLYGGAALQGSFAALLTAQLRHPELTAKLRIGTNADLGFPPIEPPARAGDGGGDLLRLGRILDNGLPEARIRAEPEETRRAFLNSDGSINAAHPIIGDTRNDENLAVAQVHLGLARFHNKVVDHAHRIGGPKTDKGDAAFAFARRQVRLHYQWLVLHDVLPRICFDGVLEAVRRERAPVYRAFFDRLAAEGQASAARLPLPFEFSVAAYRFGHSMARPSYDWSRNFGRGAVLAERATFTDFFDFTGRRDTPFAGQATRLPAHWIGDMARMTDESGTFPDRHTRAIDTVLAPDLGRMVNEEKGLHARMRHLAERNLRRGYRLALPSAQGCLVALSSAHGIDIDPLGTAALEAGPGGAVLKAANMLDDTPLWYYVLREAEVLAKGRTLGPLGSRLVAETLVGLLECDPDSVIFAGGAKGAWSPHDGVMPAGEPVTTFARLLRAAGFHS